MIALPDGDPCGACERKVKLGILKQDQVKCDECKWTIDLLPENVEAVQFIERLGPGLLMGGHLNAEVIRLGFESQNIPPENRQAIMDKLNIYLSVVLEDMISRTES